MKNDFSFDTFIGVFLLFLSSVSFLHWLGFSQVTFAVAAATAVVVFVVIIIALFQLR